MKELTDEEIILSGLSGNINGDLEGRRRKSRISTLGANKNRLKMIEVIPQLPANVQKLLKDDRAQISDKRLWAVAQLKGTSTDVILKNHKSAAGITNIDDAELAENQYFRLYGISLYYRTNETGKWDELFPDFLADAQYYLKLGNRELLGKNPVDDFQSPVFGYSIDKPFGYLELDNPKLLTPKKNIVFRIEDAPRTMSGYIKLKLHGIEVKAY